MHPTHVPLRVATGAYILNSGLNKLKASEEEAEQMHSWTSSVYPMFAEMKAGDFTKLLGYAEIGLGTALLVPKVPSLVAGSALAAFGAGLTGLYLKTPGMTQEDGIRPTAEGTSLAKDVWLVGAGLTLALQSFASGTKHAAKAVAGGVTGAAGAVADGVTGAAGSVVEGVSDVTHSFTSGISDAVGSGSSAGKKVKKTAKKAAKKADKGAHSFLSGAHEVREELSDALADFAEVLLKR